MNSHAREIQPHETQDELTQIQRAQNGDKAAMEELLHSVEKKVYNTAYRYMGSEADAFDMAQETLIKVYRGLGAFRAESLFSSWVYRLCVNTCLDGLRKRRKTPILLDLPLENFTTASDETHSPEIRALSLESRASLQKAISTLSDEHKTMVILRDVNGLSYEEIASCLEISMGTVKSRICRARQKLRELLGDMEPSV